MHTLMRAAPLVRRHARVLRQVILPSSPRVISAVAPAAVSWPEPTLSADDLEGVLRSSFKSLGCTTMAVLERCRLGERGVSAEIHDGLWIQAWIAGGTVLWVIPNIPQLSMMVRDPALSESVMTSLLEHGAGRKESFFLGRPPLTVGYKFGPVREEILRSPAALGDHLDNVLTMVLQQARIIALESRAGAGGIAAELPASVPALPAPQEQAPGATNGQEKPSSCRELAAQPSTSAASLEERDVCQSVGHADSVAVAEDAATETMLASKAASVSAPTGASSDVSITRPTPGSGELAQLAQDAPPAESSESKILTTASPASEREAQHTVKTQSGDSQTEAQVVPSASSSPIDPNALAWFERVHELYLEPFTASGDREWPFVISIQDTPTRKVGMHFINKTGLDFRHFAESAEEYHRAARERGFSMDISVHQKGHHRLAITHGEVELGPSTGTTSPPQDMDPESTNSARADAQRTVSPLAHVIPRRVVAFPERSSLPDLTVGC